MPGSAAEHAELDEVRARLLAVKQRRGYLLPHHGLLAVSAPALLAAYDATYSALTLQRRRLSEHDKEFVWLAVLIATDEAIATHHLAKFRSAGGSEHSFDAALRVVALAQGAKAFRFVADHWHQHLPGWSESEARKALREAAFAGHRVPVRLLLLAEAAVHVCLDQWRELAATIEEAYAARVDESDLAEALSLTMFPAGVPRFVEAAGVWLQLIRASRVEASPAYRAWAEIGGQGGFDEATRTPPAEAPP